MERKLPAVKRGIKVVGTPIGTLQYIHACCNKVLRKEEKLFDSIPKLSSLQAAWLLLYYCAIPRFNHMLRTLAPEDVARYAALHDEAVLNCFRVLFRIPDEVNWDSRLHRLDYDIWVRQARLPQRLGGYGLRNSNRISFAAFWASWADSLPIIAERFPVIGDHIL